RSGKRLARKRHQMPSAARIVPGTRNQRRHETSPRKSDSNPIEVKARIINEPTKTRRLWDIILSPGKRSKSTIPGIFRHQLRLRKMRSEQNKLRERCLRLNQANGATSRVANKPA